MDELDVPAALYDALRAVPGIAGARSLPERPRPFPGDLDLRLFGRRGRPPEVRRFHIRSRAAARTGTASGPGEVIVSESFARRFGVRAGETLPLDGVAGSGPTRVAGVFYDYTSEHGVVMMDRSLYLRLFEDPTIDSLGVFVEPGHPRRAEILADVVPSGRRTGLPALSRDELHANALQVFDSAFAVTRSMRAAGRSSWPSSASPAPS